MFSVSVLSQELGFNNVERLAMDLSEEGEQYFNRAELQQDMSHVFVFKSQK